MPTIFKTDIVIIGAGPVGMFTVFQAGMLGLKSIVIDSLECLGGQCSALYPEKPIYDIPGFPEIIAENLIKNLEKQANVFKPQYLLNRSVEKLNREHDRWHLTTSAGDQIDATCVIIAAGCGAFGPNKPPLENIEEFEGKSIFYMVTRREDFRNKEIVIAGGGDSAVDWALSLSEIARKIYVVHRRPKFRAAPGSIAKLDDIAKNGNIELVIPYQLHSLQGQGGYLEAVNVATLEGDLKSIKADVLLPFFGLSMDLGPIIDWQLHLENKQIMVDYATMQTNREGIFAIGDVATYKGKLKLILTGFAEAAIACHHAYSIVNPDKALHFEYSTTKGLPSHELLPTQE